MLHYYAIYKPFQVLSQFSPQAGKRTLKDVFDVPTDVYPVGRLDYDSEGLLILTNDKEVNHHLLNPEFNHEREYWVQVEGIVDESSLQKLRRGVEISVDGKKMMTKECRAEIFSTEPKVPDRYPTIRFRKNIPTSWIRLVITEGKNRQVRKMTAAVSHPTLRLIRYRIKKISIEGLESGEMRELERKEIWG